MVHDPSNRVEWHAPGSPRDRHALAMARLSSGTRAQPYRWASRSGLYIRRRRQIISWIPAKCALAKGGPTLLLLLRTSLMARFLSAVAARCACRPVGLDSASIKDCA